MPLLAQCEQATFRLWRLQRCLLARHASQLDSLPRLLEPSVWDMAREARRSRELQHSLERVLRGLGKSLATSVASTGAVRGSHV
jgi:hypothetical protein